MIVLGIDIGLTGAIARIGGGLPAVVTDLPTLPDGEPRPGKGNRAFQPKRLDGRRLVELLRELCPPDEKAMVIIEDVRPRPNPTRGTSIITEGSLMRSRGVVEAAVEIQRLDLHTVHPQTWMRLYGISANGVDALEKARVLYPPLHHRLTRKLDHNRADSILLAHWGQRSLT